MFACRHRPFCSLPLQSHFARHTIHTYTYTDDIHSLISRRTQTNIRTYIHRYMYACIRTCPKTTCWPSKWGAGAVRIKNWDPFECLPALAMLKMPAFECVCVCKRFSSCVYVYYTCLCVCVCVELRSIWVLVCIGHAQDAGFWMCMCVQEVLVLCVCVLYMLVCVCVAI